jgi:metal-sulfur cluster biosynthetic enzyme
MNQEAESALYDQIREALMDVEDPEIGINIVDLGLIYGLDLSDKGVFITLTLTSMACPLQDYIEEDIRDVLTASIGETPVLLNWTYAPPWTPTMMTDEGREMFRAIGGHVPSY